MLSGAKYDNMAGILLFSMKIGFQFFILFSPFLPLPLGLNVPRKAFLRLLPEAAVVNGGRQKDNGND
tara:strand:- start:192 stop:392 length:201 start_codon:yes stop_codon:yes gene_type:complete